MSTSARSDGERAHAGAREAVVEADRQLSDPPEPERARDGEQLEIEREPLDEQQRQHLLGHLAAEHLEPDLRVADVEPEEHANELLVEPARDPARARVVDVGVGMPLRADREVEVLLLARRQERGQPGRVEVEVGVDVGDPASARLERAGLDRVALAEIPVVVDDPNAARSPPRAACSAVPSIEPSETTISSKRSSRPAAIDSWIVATFSAIAASWL